MLFSHIWKCQKKWKLFPRLQTQRTPWQTSTTTAGPLAFSPPPPSGLTSISSHLWVPFSFSFLKCGKSFVWIEIKFPGINWEISCLNRNQNFQECAGNLDSWRDSLPKRANCKRDAGGESPLEMKRKHFKKIFIKVNWKMETERRKVSNALQCRGHLLSSLW